MSVLSDTTPAAQQVWISIFRRASTLDKARALARAFADARRLHAAGFLRRSPGADDRAVLADWLQRHMLPLAPLGRGVGGGGRDVDQSNLDVLEETLAVFTRLGIAHALGGSMASSLHGVPRFTLDADVAAEPFPDKIAEFAASFPPPYYVSAESIHDAHRDSASFNIIHTEVGFKIDVFIRPDQPFAVGALARRQHLPLSERGQAVSIQTAEDVILYKLQWFRISGGVSQQQWPDVLGILTVQQGKLDDAYLDRWADELGVADLLRQARADAK
jgi:hypothetical protein